VARLYKGLLSNIIRYFENTTLVEIMFDRSIEENISVGEVGYVKQRRANYQFVIMDSDTREVLDILKSRQFSDSYLRLLPAFKAFIDQPGLHEFQKA
jgi:transposase